MINAHEAYSRAHISQCNAIAQRSPEDMARMLRFVLATIQQGLETVPTIMREFEEHGPAAPFAFGSKRTGLQYLEENTPALYERAMAATGDPVALLRVFLDVPGLGLVKAGFACQLFAGTVGCLDVHNIRMHGLNANALRSDRYKRAKREATRQAAAQDYVDLCEALGGAVALWGAWCEYKGELSPQHFAGGVDVSRLHVDCLAGTYKEFTNDPVLGVDAFGTV